MRWITNICRAVHFVPWPEADNLASSVLNDHNSLLPETREFLDYYLRNHSLYEDYVSSTEDEMFSTTSHSSISSSAPPLHPLDSLEILLAAMNQSARFPIHRNHPVPSEYGLVHRPQQGAPTRLLTVAPDFAVYPPYTPASPAALPIFSVSAAPPTTPLFPEATKLSSARAVAASYNDLFSEERHADPSRRELMAVRSAMRVVAQAITQALLSQSGEAGLSNGIQAVLFRVERREDLATPPGDSGEAPVIIRVSRGFRTDSRGLAGPVHALVGLCRHAITTVQSENDRAGRVRDCALRVGNMQTECFYDDRVPGSLGKRIARLGVDGDVSEEDASIARILQKHRGVLGVGRSGVVLESELEHTRVAVKMWNEVHVDGLYDLLAEIEVYQQLRREHPSVLGSVLPRVVMAREEPETEAVLVTELVGKSLRRGDEGILLMGDGAEWEAVEVWEEENIIQAARASLRRLHRCGVSHGDVSLGNVRVARRRRFRGWAWHVWWIDLGNAEVEDVGDECDIDAVDIFRFEMDRVDRLLAADE